MKKYILILSLLALLAVPALADETVDDCFDMAKNFYDTEDYAQAMEYTNSILNLNPTHFGANFLKIMLTPPKGSLQKTNLTNLIVLRSTNVSTEYKQSDEYNLKGQQYYEKQDYKNAKTAFSTAIKYNFGNSYAYNNLGLAYWKLGHLKKAEFALKRANSLNPTYTLPLDNLAQMNIENGHYKKACKYLNKAINLNKNDYCAHYLMGTINKIQLQYSEAIKNFSSAANIEPDFALSYLQLADIYYLTKDYSWSNASIEKYLEQNPKDDYAYYMLSRNYLMLKDYNIAKNYIIKAMLLNNCIDYRISLAVLESFLDNPKAALNALKSIPEPKAVILNEIGIYYLKLNDNNNALKFFKEASLKTDARPIYLYNCALVYKNIGDVDNYKKTIDELDSIKLKSYQDYIDLSGIYLDCECKNKAIAILDRGIKLSPKNKELYEAKMKVYTITSDKINADITQKEMDKVFKK